MKTHILYCPTCKTYTLQKNCTTCSQPTIHNIPPRFSLEDHYGDYRRTLKKQVRHKEEGQKEKKHNKGEEQNNG